MIPQDPYFEALIHCPHRVLGFSLKPFSWSHYEYLRAIGSPVASGEIDSLQSLAIAVGVCRSDDPLKNGVKYPARLRISAGFLPWNLEREAMKFRVYLEDFASLPETAESYTVKAGGKCKKTKPTIVPVALRIIARLVSMGIPEREAWTMPMAKTIWLGYADAENNGVKLTLLTEWELQTLREIHGN
jgi:hypothetical protein